MTDSDPRLADSTRSDADTSSRSAGADRDDRNRDNRPRMRDVNQTAPNELDANGVWSRGPATPTDGSDDAAPDDD